MSRVVLDHDWFPLPVPANVSMGEGSWLYSAMAFLRCRSTRPLAVRIGRKCGIYKGCFFDLGPDGEVEIGDYCALVGAVISTNARVVVRDYAFIAHEVVIADDAAAVPWRGRSTHAAGARSEIVVGENSWIGARAILLPGAHIGQGAIVGAAAVVDFPVPDLAIAAGNPARIVGRVTASSSGGEVSKCRFSS